MLLSPNNILYPSAPSKPKPLSNHFHLQKPYISLNPPKTTFLIRSSKSSHPQAQKTTQESIKPLPSSSAIERIADKLRSLGFTATPANQNPNPNPNSDPKPEPSVGEIFIPLPNQLAKYRVGHTLDPSWSTPENPVPRPGSGNAIRRYHDLEGEVKEERLRKNREDREKGRVPSLAELELERGELRRLRNLGIKEKNKLKVGKAGITEGIVNGIHERWRRAEVVKIECEDLCRINMKRTHELLESKTGGLVVWRSGSKVVLYRGAKYRYPYFSLNGNTMNENSPGGVQDKSGSNEVESTGPIVANETARPALIQGVGSANRVRFQLPGEAQLSEEVDRLLDGLGPRFTDWWGVEPLPVDADLLPAVVPGYRWPFRLLPYGVKPILTNDEMTTLKRLGRPLPCHFALGRNRKLQGLAAAIVKLWERCEIAKIAVKRGVQNTNSQLMAEELKFLTGGVLLSRDREFIVLYRGKDFLPPAVSSAIEERKKHAIRLNKQLTNSTRPDDTLKELTVGTMTSSSTDQLDGVVDRRCDHSEHKKLSSTEEAIRRTSIKLSTAVEKKENAEKALAQLEKESPKQPEIDKEGLTAEEKYMLRTVGLKMKPFLLMGRRGVFDGTIENMHLHWKYRELVKLICKERSLKEVYRVANILEVESGGILVAVERVSKGYAIIIYRGKNYSRPACLRPPTLLSKREALKRSLEEQRRQSLKLHVLRLNDNIDDLKHQLTKDKEGNNIQSSAEPQFQTRDKDMVASNSLSPDASVDTVQPAQQASPAGRTSMFDGNLPDPSPESLSEETHETVATGIRGEAFDSVPSPDDFTPKKRRFTPLVDVEHSVSRNDEERSIVESANYKFEESVATVAEEKHSISVDEDMRSLLEPAKSRGRVVHLSNRDRLLLRKQALKMKKRPVLAVGRSNIVTGVAKTIKAHFEKYPLAIVNIKGRAKGTSVQEVVFQLEQATGAVLVSQEPCKVILYRGWGAEDERGPRGKKTARAGSNTSVLGRNDAARPAVSPELMEAIRFECGLLHKHEK